MFTNGEKITQQDNDLITASLDQMSGPETLKEIRSRGADVFVVGVTGNAQQSDVDFFRACGLNK